MLLTRGLATTQLDHLGDGGRGPLDGDVELRLPWVRDPLE